MFLEFGYAGFVCCRLRCCFVGLFLIFGRVCGLFSFAAVLCYCCVIIAGGFGFVIIVVLRLRVWLLRLTSLLLGVCVLGVGFPASFGVSVCFCFF